MSSPVQIRAVASFSSRRRQASAGADAMRTLSAFIPSVRYAAVVLWIILLITEVSSPGAKDAWGGSERSVTYAVSAVSAMVVGVGVGVCAFQVVVLCFVLRLAQRHEGSGTRANMERATDCLFRSEECKRRNERRNNRRVKQSGPAASLNIPRRARSPFFRLTITTSTTSSSSRFHVQARDMPDSQSPPPQHTLFALNHGMHLA